MVSKELLQEITEYLNVKYMPEQQEPLLIKIEPLMLNVCGALGGKILGEETIEDLVSNLDEPFSQTLMRLIDSKKMTDSDVYRRANIDRRLFAKIRKPDYRPGKQTVLALAIAIELDLDETKQLLERAGFALSRSQKSDVIIEYFIKHKMYDIHEINDVLFEYDLQTLGASV